jgi:16S rRNA G966 N2-methylase RsmD
VPSSSPQGPEPKLTKREVESIAARLERGEFLDDHWRNRLFRQAKEAELRYLEKQARGSVLADTMAVPFQTLKRFGGSGKQDWANRLVLGDNLQVLKTLFEMKERGELLNADGTPGVRLCYIDPPFATKREFRGKRGQAAYRDRVEGTEFIEFLRRRLIFIHELLAKDGVLYLHLDTNKVHYMKVLLDEIFGPENFRTEIIWKRSSAHSDTKQGRRQHGRIHDTILFYSKGPQWTWNPLYTDYDPAYVSEFYRYVEEDTGRTYRLGDLTAAKPGGDTQYEFHGRKPYKGRYWAYSREKMEELCSRGLIHFPDDPKGVPSFKRYLDEQPGVSLQDIWLDIKPVPPSERTDFPTQKPRALLERIIRSSTAEGDLVLDCFGGSGTTAVEAEALGRRWIAIDCGKLAVYTTQQRLLSLTEGNGKRASRQLAPFEFCAAGLYDNTLLENLPFDRYRDFVLELFGCKSAPHKLGRVPMVGTRKGGPVHLFPFNETEAQMGRAYIESLHQRLSLKVSGEVYVIAPMSACDPALFEDVITLGENTYFVLRVPYSAIEALHGRDFEPPSQPGSSKELNDAIDSFGFDFVELPEAKLTYTQGKDSLQVEIEEFRRGGLDPDDFDELEDAGRRDLAMVMADTSYDGDGFRLREHYFGDELAKSDWSFKLDLEKAGAHLLIIFMDSHGNERREVFGLAAKRGKSKTARKSKSSSKVSPARKGKRKAKA